MEEEYIMKQNEEELKRLANQHDTLKSGMGTLVVAPIDLSRPRLRILDSGTADGLWLADLKSTLVQAHEYIGTDLVSAYFPAKHPQGIHFQLQSIAQKWPESWQRSFDYVHQRLTLPGAGRTPIVDCVANLAGLVKPGGWIELVEADFSGSSENGPFLQEFERMMAKMLDVVGVGRMYSSYLFDYLKHAGLAEVHERVYRIPYGVACSQSDIAEKSAAHIVSAAEGLSMFLTSQDFVLHDGRGNELAAVDFMAGLRNELESRGAFFKMKSVWAQRDD